MKNHMLYAVPAFFVIVFLWTNSIQGRNVVNSKCRSDRPIVKNFDAKKFIGKWYEIYRYDTLWQKDCGCVTANYTIETDSSMIIRNCCYKMNTGFCVEVHTSPRYTILDTDYDNFAIIFDCVASANYLPTDALWVLSRTPQLNLVVKAKVKVLLDEYFNRKQFITTNQDVKICSAVSWLPPMEPLSLSK